MTQLLAATAAAVGLLMAAVWLLSVIRRDASVVDIFWGLGFALIAMTAYGELPESYVHARASLLLLLTTVWGVRLGLYLAWRNWRQPEDYRYEAMRRHWGRKFVWVSLLTVFGLQGVLMWFISLPLQLGMLGDRSSQLGALDWVGLLLVLVGLGFEAVGDFQLARFKSNPANRGEVMQHGLWRYTRHPNYFGDALVWWGLYAIAASTPAGRYTVLSPLLMTFLLLRVSGVPLLEKRLRRSRPEYAEYVRRTSAFVPWPPQR
jgi:steroid 5-alpha reductase family enzyme